MMVILQTTSSSAFSRLQTIEFQIKCHWNMFYRIYFTTCQYWLGQYISAKQATSRNLKQCCGEVYHLVLHLSVFIRLHQWLLPSKPYSVTRLVSKSENSVMFMSIAWYLMSWLLTSPGHQQRFYWYCRIMHQSHNTPRPYTCCLRAVHGLLWTKIIRPFTGAVRAPCGAVRISPPPYGARRVLMLAL